jgi:arylformamidase
MVGPEHAWTRRPPRAFNGPTLSLSLPATMLTDDKNESNGDKTAEPLLVDLSHTIEDGVVTYRGLPAPVICDFLSREQSRSHYAAGTEFHIGRIDMVANTGTYLDTPFHRFAHGFDLSDLSLESVANVDGFVLRFTGLDTRAITAAMIQSAIGDEPIFERAILVNTGWDRHWGTDRYFEGHPFLTADAAAYLAAHGPRLVGIDSLNIDDIDDLTRPVHTRLLGAGIPIVEHLCCLTELPVSGFRFTAVPVKVRGMGTFPVRAFASLWSAE